MTKHPTVPDDFPDWVHRMAHERETMDRINITLPPEYLEAIDQERGDMPRSEWLREMLRTRLLKKHQLTKPAETRGRPRTAGPAENEQMRRVIEVAEILGVDSDKVRRWIRSGELRAINVAHCGSSQRPRYRVPDKALAEFLESRATREDATG